MILYDVWYFLYLSFTLFFFSIRLSLCLSLSLSLSFSPSLSLLLSFLLLLLSFLLLILLLLLLLLLFLHLFLLLLLLLLQSFIWLLFFLLPNIDSLLQAVYVPMPRHIYGELARSQMGCDILEQRKLIAQLLSYAKNERSASDIRRAALWGLGHIRYIRQRIWIYKRLFIFHFDYFLLLANILEDITNRHFYFYKIFWNLSFFIFNIWIFLKSSFII